MSKVRIDIDQEFNKGIGHQKDLWTHALVLVPGERPEDRPEVNVFSWLPPEKSHLHQMITSQRVIPLGTIRDGCADATPIERFLESPEAQEFLWRLATTLRPLGREADVYGRVTGSTETLQQEFLIKLLEVEATCDRYHCAARYLQLYQDKVLLRINAIPKRKEELRERAQELITVADDSILLDEEEVLEVLRQRYEWHYGTALSED